MTFWEKIKAFFSKKDDSENSTNDSASNGSAKCSGKECKHSLHIGINDYPGTRNDLNGCVNDATGWEDLLKEQYGFKTKVLLNAEATHKNVVNEMKRVLKAAREGGHVVITYSGHGTNVKDNNNDEEDGRDEALCLYDKLLIDDDIRSLFDSLSEGVSLTFISDSCHSGTVTRTFLETLYDDEVYCKARYLPPEDDEEVFDVAPSAVSKKLFMPQDDMNEVLVTGCTSTQYSYDARISGKYQGAMSANAIAILKENPKLTYNEFYKLLRERLPSRNYPQTPQLEGNSSNLNKQMFS